MERHFSWQEPKSWPGKVKGKNESPPELKRLVSEGRKKESDIAWRVPRGGSYRKKLYGIPLKGLSWMLLLVSRRGGRKAEGVSIDNTRGITTRY